MAMNPEGWKIRIGAEPKLGDVVTHRQLRLGDIVSLDFPDKHSFMMAKVIRDSDGMITFARPYMPASRDGVLAVHFEIFTVFKDSNKTVVLMGREPGE